MNSRSHYSQHLNFPPSSTFGGKPRTKTPSSYCPPAPPRFLQRQPVEGTRSQKAPEKPETKEKTIPPQDPVTYRSKNCTFRQDYLFPLTYDPLEGPLDLQDQNSPENKNMSSLSISESAEESSPKDKASPAKPKKSTFKPYVKKEASSGFGFWSTGLEDSLLTESTFTYKTRAPLKKPVKKPIDNYTKEQKKTLSKLASSSFEIDSKWSPTMVRS
jgi:hypothetical protein